jgi:glycosyltransferase involved in cell wall biosynthesis
VDTPLLSVIITVFNTRPYLERCLESVVNQTYTNLDIILVDDGSSDGSADICDRYRERDSRIRVIHKSHGGVSVARNFGLAAALGTIVSFVDSDDWIDPGAYSPLIANFTASSADIVLFGFYRVRDPSRPETFEKEPFFDSDTLLSGEEALNLLAEDGLIKSYLWNKIYAKKLFEDLEFPPGRLYEDGFIMHKIFRRAGTVSAAALFKYYYYQREGSITTTRNIKTAVEEFDAFYSRFEELKDDDALDRKTLFLRVLHSAADLYSGHPFAIRGAYRKKLRNFFAGHRKDFTALDGRDVKNIRDRLFLKLPLFVFCLLYGPLARAARKALRGLF